MALNTDAIRKKIGPIEKNYDWKDVVLYALGVGAGFAELDYTYEKNLKVIPTFSIAMIFDFFRHIVTTSNLNPAGILHTGQDIVFHHPIPTSGTITTEGMITHFYDKGSRGAFVVAKSDTHHSSGKKIFTSVITLFGRLDGGFGGADLPRQTIDQPSREPDFIVEALPSPDQPLLYRLSGDTYQLHVDPEFAQRMGFEKPIIHGLCTYGFACRALMASLIPGKSENVQRIACLFSDILYPGEPIRTWIWKMEEGKAVWKTVSANTGKTVIDNGIFEYGAASKGRD
jgi:acyl dehydratase